MKITHIGTVDSSGGAAIVSRRLTELQRQGGHDSQLLVGTKGLDVPYSHAFPINPDTEKEALFKSQGLLDYHFRGSYTLPHHPLIKDADIINLHNLHGDYFNPASLEQITHTAPCVYTLHDMFSITGHCAHAFDCEKWKTGCGQCPDLNTYPPIIKDATATMWKDKKSIYEKSLMDIIVPSQWLKSKVEQGILSDKEIHLVYNGIDDNIFQPVRNSPIRQELGIPENSVVLGIVADNGLNNPYKGGRYLVEAIRELNKRYNNLTVLNIGAKTNDQFGIPNLITVPHIHNENTLSHLYSTLDLFIYPSLADNCPLVILEAMSCGVPIVSFNTGGIPELILDGESGILTEDKNTQSIVKSCSYLIEDSSLREKISQNARQRVTNHFSLRDQVSNYHKVYEEVILAYNKNRRGSSISFMSNITSSSSDTQHSLEEGEIFFAQGKVKEALEIFLHVCENQPSNDVAFCNAGVAFWELDQAIQSVEYFEKALGINPNNEAARLNLKDIKGLQKDLLDSDHIPHEKTQNEYSDFVESKNSDYQVSAIVSTWKSERFIEGKIQDLLKQSLGKKLEIVIIDSNSPENEKDIIHKYLPDHDNITFLRTTERETIYSAWNRAVKLAKGKFITNSNTDDRLKDNALEILANELLNTDDSVVLVYGNHFVTGYENQTFGKHIRTGYSIKPDYDPRLMLLGCHMGPMPMWKKEVHDKIGYFNPEMAAAGDYEFWCKVATKYKLKHVDEFIGLYLHNPSGIVNRDLDKCVREAQQVQFHYQSLLPHPGNAAYQPDYFYQPKSYKNKYVSIVMITYNRLDYTNKAIVSLSNRTKFPHTLTVVDNNSQDGSKEYLKTLKDKGFITNLILLDENVGVAKAANIGFSLTSDADYFLKYDNDIIVQSDTWLEDMVHTIDNIPEIGVLGYNFEPVSFPLVNVRGTPVRPKYEGNIGGALFMISKRIHHELGFFCEDYGLYGEEDADYGIRVIQAGYINAYMPNEDMGFHLPAGKAAVINQETFVAEDGLEEQKDREYRLWKDEERRKNLEANSPFHRNVWGYKNGASSLYQMNHFSRDYSRIFQLSFTDYVLDADGNANVIFSINRCIAEQNIKKAIDLCTQHLSEHAHFNILIDKLGLLSNFPSKQNSKVSILICCRDETHQLETYLGLFKQDNQYEDYEIMVADLSNSSGIETIIDQSSLNIHYHKLNNQINYPTAFNILSSKATGGLLAFGNINGVMHKNWISNLVKHTKQSAKIGILFCPTLSKDNLLISSNYNISGSFSEFSPLLPALPVNHPLSKNSINQIYVSKTFMVYKSSFEKIRGFDENIDHNYVLDLCLKYFEQGYINSVADNTYHIDFSNNPNFVTDQDSTYLSSKWDENLVSHACNIDSEIFSELDSYKQDWEKYSSALAGINNSKNEFYHLLANTMVY